MIIQIQDVFFWVAIFVFLWRFLKEGYGTENVAFIAICLGLIFAL